MQCRTRQLAPLAWAVLFFCTPHLFECRLCVYPNALAEPLACRHVNLPAWRRHLALIFPARHYSCLTDRPCGVVACLCLSHSPSPRSHSPSPRCVERHLPHVLSSRGTTAHGRRENTSAVPKGGGANWDIGGVNLNINLGGGGLSVGLRWLIGVGGGRSDFGVMLSSS